MAVIREENGTRIISYHDLRIQMFFTLPIIICIRTILYMWSPIELKQPKVPSIRIILLEFWVSVLSLLTTVAVLIFNSPNMNSEQKPFDLKDKEMEEFDFNRSSKSPYQ